MLTIRSMPRAALIALLLATAALGGCNRDAASTRPVVGLVLKTLNHPFFIDMERGARAAADSLGIELLVQAADREIDVERQMQIVENLVERHVDALAITPSGSREIVPAIVKANQANIPVIVVDTRVDSATLASAGGRTVAFIGSDNYEGGRIAGAFLARRLNGTGNVAVLEGIPGHETGDSRIRGFTEALDSFPGMTIVASQTANWERDQAFTVMQNILQSQPDLQGLFAANDLMALGAIEAIAAADRTGEIVIVGFDALEDARSAIRDGRMAGSIAQSPAEMGRAAVIAAYAAINGQPVPADQVVGIQLVSAESQ